MPARPVKFTKYYLTRWISKPLVENLTKKTGSHRIMEAICATSHRGTLQWRQNEYDGVSNHRRLGCLLNHFCRRRSKETSKLRVTGLCEGNSPVTGEFPAQRVSNAELWCFHWWRHHHKIDFTVYIGTCCIDSVKAERANKAYRRPPKISISY